MIILKENVNLRPYWDGKANYNRFSNATNMTTSASLVLWMNQRGYDLINVDDAIKELNEREQFILDERFVVGKTQMEVAQEIGISQAQVSRLEKNALRVMRNYLH